MSLRLHSSHPDIAERWNAWDVAGEPITSDGTADPFRAIDEVEASLARSKATGTPARRAGYVAYEVNRWIEALPPIASSSLPSIPTVAFWPVAEIRAIDSQTSKTDTTLPSLRRLMSRDEYLAAARRSLDYIAAGDVFQLNLAQTFEIVTSTPAEEVWRRLVERTPSAYGAFIQVDSDTAILSNSPELFFCIEPLPDGRRRITTRPIKGTRPRGPGMRDELERSEKDKAELAMIVDLERNDLGRICEIGTVRVVEPRVIEEHPTVYHGVATIEGFLRPDVTLADVFRAMFPCGSITGCPKVRAMEIIDELEGQPRGPYCGAIGYIDADGSAEFSVAIRTMTLSRGTARVSVGGGIVADSNADDEYRETIDKARAMLSALGMSREQIDALRAE